MVFAAMERLKHRIHAFRMPIKDKRVFFLVQCAYFLAPIVRQCCTKCVFHGAQLKREELFKNVKTNVHAAHSWTGLGCF